MIPYLLSQGVQGVPASEQAVGLSAVVLADDGSGHGSGDGSGDDSGVTILES